MGTTGDLVDQILSSRKYRTLGIPRQTVEDLIHQENPQTPPRLLAKSVRQKLHNIMAPYLGDPNYTTELDRLKLLTDNGTPDQLKEFCQLLLASHASTRERFPTLSMFYQTIFSVTGVPETILDLACGLNPFSFAWMGMPAAVKYHAYDIHQPRVMLVNAFFQHLGLDPLADVRDILVDPPQIDADIAFFLKEAHRFEQRQHGCNRAFWQALNVTWLCVSLPATSLTGRHDLADFHRRLVYKNLDGLSWPVIEHQVGNELIFLIHKNQHSQ
jgi:16S rRNA (guanine(1405)-N(7))-methyltransferase